MMYYTNIRAKQKTNRFAVKPDLKYVTIFLYIKCIGVYPIFGGFEVSMDDEWVDIWFIVTIPPYLIDNIECKVSLGWRGISRV